MVYGWTCRTAEASYEYPVIHSVVCGCIDTVIADGGRDSFGSCLNPDTGIVVIDLISFYLRAAIDYKNAVIRGGLM